MQGHEHDQAAVVPDRVLVGDERDVLEEPGERRTQVLLTVLTRDADELLQILDPAAGLDRALGLEGLDRSRTSRAGAGGARPPGSSCDAAMSDSSSRGNPRIALRRRGADAGRLRVRQRVPRRAARRGRHARRGAASEVVAVAAAREVRDTEQRTRFRRFTRTVRSPSRRGSPRARRTRPPITWYGLLADEHVFEHARLRVRPVEDRDLARGEAWSIRPAISAATNRASACRPRPGTRVPARPRRGRKRFFGLRSRF